VTFGRNLQQHRLAYCDVFGAAAIDCFADHPEAVTLAKHRVDQHALSEPVSGGTRPHAVDRPGDVGADHHRQRNLDARHAAPGEQIMEIHGASGDAYQHFAVTRNGPRIVVAKFQHLEATVSGGQHGLHRLAHHPAWVP
jgi:hypothetical protein